MDRLSIISGALFFTADVFAVISLALPNWIVSDIGGRTYIGLMESCLSNYNQPQTCFTTSPLRLEWLLTFVCIILGIHCITATIILLIMSHWKYRIMKHARWLGFIAMVLFCKAAVIFPIGFNMEQIGGKAYQLPNNYQVGISYIFFVLALWITVVSELFASKVCLPHF
ncbi:modulator of smoothened protein-like [Ylistrum balloti]|uniref:modulator of smoothened protein-like n=1 Tax=Ylistrum balloti TaxID=509963 RepID=UPI002905D4AC|nr:modulator of smoothened protein-like [Ylistrum balloti]